MFFALIALVSALSFTDWVQMHNKQFSPVELLRRKAIFADNARIVAEHNAKSTFKLSLEGPFAAMTNEEYRGLLGRIPLRQDIPTEEFVFDNHKAIPASLDWRTENVVPAIRDQAACGSCYAFGALAAFESRLLIRQGGNVDTMDLSEQEVVDCSGNHGCNGGLGSAVYYYIAMSGIGKEADYPYTAKTGTCRAGNAARVAKLTSITRTARGCENALVNALQDGPVDVAIDASHYSFQLYTSGIYYESKCANGFYDLNHEVCAVGYGSSSDGDYWIVRNSWGVYWGTKGYIRMARNRNNNCGIATDPVFPTDPTYV